MSNVICDCKEWQVSADQIFGAQGLAAAHGCNYTGSVFNFCPWCGRHLTQQSSGQETPVCNCIKWKDFTAGWCPVHRTINSCR